MVSQRLAGVPMETNGILAVPADGGSLTLLGLPPGAALDPRRLRPAAGSRPGQAPRRHPVGGRRVRSEGGGVRRAPDHRRGGPAARPPGEVDRDPLRGHGLARPRPRLRDDRAARCDQRRQDRRATTRRWWRRPGPTRRIGAILPMLTQMMSVGVYDIPSVRFKTVGGDDEQHHHRRLPGRRAVPRRRSSSSGSWTWRPPSSTWIPPRSGG